MCLAPGQAFTVAEGAVCSCKQMLYVSISVSNQQQWVCVIFFRVIYLQVSMNEGLSYITSSVHITTTECVSAHGTAYTVSALDDIISL